MGWIVHWAHSVHPGSVIVHIIYQDGVAILESKNQSPVPADPHCEVSLQSSVYRPLNAIVHFLRMDHTYASASPVAPQHHAAA